MSEIYPEKKIGLLRVLYEVDRTGTNVQHRMWGCECECGNFIKVASNDLKRNVENKSCGCHRDKVSSIRNTTHGDSNTRLYNTWASMKKRCSNPNHAQYKNYGGRGITYIKEWEEYIPFRKWASESGYNDKLTLERIDNNKSYSPNNCKWATILEQANNKRNNHNITYEGKTQSISKWSRELGINRTTLTYRLRKGGWSVDKAFTTHP